MQKDLTGYRKSYEKDRLSEEMLPASPWNLFEEWFNLADASRLVEEANAMSLATVDSKLIPKSRIVLLKSYDTHGFQFFTNYQSDKGKHLEENPYCCLSFFWPSLEKQVIIKGKASKLSREHSENYFHSRPHGSQLGALVSHQSSVIPSRVFLKNKLKELENKYENKEIPKPEYWGGYIVKPISFEFWQGRKNRLHDRIYYSPVGENWKIERLAP